MITSIREPLSSMLKTVIFALTLSYLVQAVAIESRIVPSTSMLPTIVTDQRILINKLSYRHTLPQRGDLIVFRSPDDPNTDYIKRVIALPGEVVEIKNGTVFINGEPLQENYILEKPSYHLDPVLVPENSLFVLGDNRNISYDSHLWSKWLTLDQIRGQAIFTYWPATKIGLL